MKRFSIGVLWAAMGLAGCAPQEQPQFYKDNVSDTERQRDEYECERDTRMAAGSFGYGAVGNSNAREFAIKCMAARGYYYGPYRNAPLSSVPIAPTPMSDASGKTYQPGDDVMCKFPNNVSPLQFKAGLCSKGGGSIVGPA